MKGTMRTYALLLCITVLGILGAPLQADETSVRKNLSGKRGNPVIDGWYADPEAAIFGKEYWIYPTYSAPYDQQVFFDAFSSPDLAHWTKHPRILDTQAVKWARRAMWAPAIVEKGGKYYFFFSANDIQERQKTVGGIGVAVADHPDGPFRDYLGKPLIGAYHNGAQPIDQFVFKDKDGQFYIIYGGHRHCNIARLNANFTGLLPLVPGSDIIYKEITPGGYVEGPLVFLRNGKYYLMWSEGGWTGPNLRRRLRRLRFAPGPLPAGPAGPPAGSQGCHRRRPSFALSHRKRRPVVHRLPPPSAGRPRP
jgi:beta-xylosidase